MTTRQTWRIALPTLLAFLGVWLLAGCFYLPAPTKPRAEGGPDPLKLVGPSDSDKPIRPGAITRDRVVQLLGQPWRRSADERTFGYRFDMRAGTWVMPLCFYAHRAERAVAVRLDFDESGVLVGYEMAQGDPSKPNVLSTYSAPWPPLWRRIEDITQPPRPSTRPLTLPSTSPSPAAQPPEPSPMP